MGDLSVAERRGRAGREPSKIPYYVVLSALAFFALAPLLVLVFNSLKSNAEVGRNPLGPPTSPVFENFPTAWAQGNFATTLVNSTILTLGTVVGVCVIAGMAAYAMARLDLPGTDGVLLYLFVASALPFQLFLVPLFFLWNTLTLTNTLFGLVVIYWAIFSPFATLLLRSYLVALPRGFEDAARIDGASEWQVFTRVVLPLSWPGFLTIALVSALGAWNEFFFAVTFIQDDALKPVSTSFLAFQSQFSQDWGLTSAASILIMLPVVVLFLLLQRRFIDGLTAGGLKG
ncbi:carbohydrate ABC transporter permease [Rubrobacter marinus]|uniref:carbohydrate ABC transporter permease n=1 Tax=Rubrobacter marinus TaxID=2653852 RepID=UPI001A9F24B1|nr:carbohydrate ABC transporter permease [Rubrobacter marinus]